MGVAGGEEPREADRRPVMDDPEALPPEIRPFALTHTAGLERLREATEEGAAVDWLMLTPPARLEHGTPRTGRYRLGGETAPDGAAHLSYADLAVAVLDEIETPTRHRTRVSVSNPGGSSPAA